MVKPARLYRNLLDNPRQVVSFREFERLIEYFGFEHRRTKGSHRSYRHPACPHLLVVQPKGSDAKSYQVRELLALVEEYDLTLKP